MIAPDPHADRATAVAEELHQGLHATHRAIVSRSPEELYAFWRPFTSVPRFLTHLERVDALGEGHWRWIVSLPRLFGRDGVASWEVALVDDAPASLLSWRSVGREHAGACTGQVTFTPVPAKQGTLVEMQLAYQHLGSHHAAKGMLPPDQRLREDLRRFQRWIETGEAPTTAGQPRGHCSGWSRIPPE